ncbi:MAG: hypothetical protein E7632_10960 [Ruminococcaceae bacterium]|nr:hypothetical protein [Oscillospiraceae bacterium]
MNIPVSIRDFGAVPDGITDCTEPFRRAVEAGYGKAVVFPAGVYVSGPICLAGDTEYVLEAGCILRASERARFVPIGYHHNEMADTTSFLWAIGAQNITIRGEGTIDFGASQYYNRAASMCGGEMYQKNSARLNQPMFFDHCRNVRVSGLRLINSPCWTLTFSESENITAEHLTIKNDPLIPNSDGIHFSACRSGVVRGCTISGGDDCIALTCITKKDGCNRDITVNDCILSSNSAGIRIGHNAEQIRMSDIRIVDANRGIGIFTANGTVIRDVELSDITMQTRPRGLCWWGNGDGIVIAAAQDNSRIEDVEVSRVSGNAGNGVIVYGNGHNVENVRLRDICLSLSGEGNAYLDLRPYDARKLSESHTAYIVSGTRNTWLENVYIGHSGGYIECTDNENLSGEIRER